MAISKRKKPWGVKAQPSWATISHDRFFAMETVCNTARKIHLSRPLTIEQIEFRKALLWLDEVEKTK